MKRVKMKWSKLLELLILVVLVVKVVYESLLIVTNFSIQWTLLGFVTWLIMLMVSGVIYDDLFEK